MLKVPPLPRHKGFRAFDALSVAHFRISQRDSEEQAFLRSTSKWVSATNVFPPSNAENENNVLRINTFTSRKKPTTPCMVKLISLDSLRNELHSDTWLQYSLHALPRQDSRNVEKEIGRWKRDGGSTFYIRCPLILTVIETKWKRTNKHGSIKLGDQSHAGNTYVFPDTSHIVPDIFFLVVKGYWNGCDIRVNDYSTFCS